MPQARTNNLAIGAHPISAHAPHLHCSTSATNLQYLRRPSAKLSNDTAEPPPHNRQEAIRTQATHLLHTLDPVTFVRDRLHFTPDPHQQQVLDLFARFGILNCSRQYGKSTVTALKAVHRAYFFPNSTILVLSPTERQSANLVRKCRKFLQQLDLPLKGDPHHRSSIVLPNGSVIYGLPGTDDTNRGYSAPDLVLIDEASRVTEDAFQALTPALATNLQAGLWLMSTPAGKQGFFYNTWITAGPEWTKIQVKATDCPRISPEHLARERAIKSETLFAQEYLCQFTEGGCALLNIENLTDAVTPEVLPLFREGNPTYILQGHPINSNPNARYFIGVDLGQQRNFTAIAILQRETRTLDTRDPVTFAPHIEETYAVRHLERLPLGTSYSEVADYIAFLTRHIAVTGRCEVILDATGLGAPVADMLRSRGMKGPLHRVILTGGDNQTTNQIGTGIPRRDLISRLHLAIEQKKLSIARDTPATRDLLKELANLEMHYTPAGRLHYEPGGQEKQDDLTIATSLAWWKAQIPKAGDRTERLL